MGKKQRQQAASKQLIRLVQQKEAAFLSAWDYYQRAQDDPEALHEMRVELRRLRVWLRLTRGQVKTRKRARQQLKALAKASNPLRDHEVQITWLSHAQQVLNYPLRLNNLVDYGRHRLSVTAKLQLSRKIRLRPRPESGDQTALSDWLQQTVAERVQLIDSLLRADLHATHSARIQIKHLRYLLEPFRPSIKESKPLIKWCKHTQNLLGDLHDIDIMRHHLPTFAGWVIEQELPPALNEQDDMVQAIQQVFSHAEQPITALAAWQSQVLQEHWQHWLATRDQCLQQLAQDHQRLQRH